MSLIKQEEQVVYVEPNAMDDITLYNTKNGKVYKSTELEDLCISVDLEVEVKGRTFASSKNAASNNMQMSWQSSADGQTIRFMKGTKIATGVNKDGFVNSLTTNYTDCFLYDVESEGTCEMFGIKSIDISYNNFMVPEVTIQFIDVRGVSLFAQEEMRHNVVKNGMTGVANNSVEGSFFKCFFTFPYPKFTLKVKGFYGEMVSYELTCSDFRAVFDSNTGNFNVTAKFIGYAFSFLNDVMTNALLAAPYSEYIGSQYWNDNIANNRFSVKDSAGSDVGMKRLGEICEEYKKVKASVEQEFQTEGATEFVRKAKGDESAKKVDDGELNPLRQKYTGLIADLAKACEAIKGSYGDVGVNVPNTNSYFAVTDGENEDLEDLKTIFEGFNSELKQKNSKVIKDWLAKNGNFQIIKKDDYGDIMSNKDNCEVDKDIIKEDATRKAIHDKALEKIEEDTTYRDKWDGIFDENTIYVYQDFGLNKILGENSNVTDDASEVAEKEIEEAKQIRERQTFEKVFSFPPTVENITKIIMAHFETYVYCISECAKHIIGSNRTTETLGLSIDSLPDSKSNNESDSANSVVPVAPFPSITKKVELDGVSKTEDAWVGEFGGQDKFEEISLIEGLLKGIETVSNAITNASTSTDSDIDVSEKSSVKNILSYVDLFMKNGDNPFGNANLNSLDDVFARFCVRAFATMATQAYSDINSVTLGKLDAETFYELFGNNPNIGKLRDGLANVTSDKIYEFVKNGTKETRLDANAKSNPWYAMNHLLSTGDEKHCYLTVGMFSDDSCVIPLKNLSWKEWNGVYKYKKGIKSGNLSNYTLTNKPNKINDNNSIVITSMDAPLKYIQQSYNSLSTSSYADDGIKNHFKPLIFTKESVLKDTYLDGVRFTKIGVEDSIAYDEILSYTDSGKVDSAENIAYVFQDNVFMDKGYIALTSNQEKAAYFLLNAFPKISNSVYNEFGYNSPRFKYMPKLSFLQIGAIMWEAKNGKSKKTPWVRETIENYFINSFTSWANSKFNDIKNAYELRFAPGVSYESFTKAIKNLSGDELRKAVLKRVADAGDFNQKYEILSYSTKLNCKALPCKAMSSLISELFQVTAVCTMTKFNLKNWEWDNDNAPVLDSSKIKGYLEGVISVLKEKLGEPESNSESTGTNSSAQTSIAIDPDDIKIGVYNYIKMLYDKWISSDLDNINYKMETMFYSEEPTFHFVDSAYNRIGKSMYINLGTLVDMLVSSQTQNGYSMLSMMSGLYSSNKFQFMCLQNFADLSKPDMMEKMFRPIPYIDATQPKNHPDFVVLYPYEASSHLDVKGADYPDDSFYLNDSTTWPIMVSEKNMSTGYPIPAFGVSYGQQYQNYFKNIQVDMNTPMATEQSIKAKFLVSGANVDGEDNGEREITIGQDLYTIYSNNSYTCTVTMMGCAWIQPMMYFVLNNVPMFRGSYLICKVNHQIEAGNMITTFKGVRMARKATRSVRDFIYGRTSDSTNGHGSDENPQSRLANVGNNCEYAYTNPLGVNVDTPDSGEPNAYCKSAYNAFVSAGLTPNQAKGICANIFAESNFEPYMLTIDGDFNPNTYHSAGGGLCGFRGVDKNGNHGGDAIKLFQYAYKCNAQEAIKKLKDLTIKTEPYWKGVPCSTTTTNALKKANIKFPIPFKTQVEYICELTKKDYSGIRSCKTPQDAALYWLTNYERPAKKVDRWEAKKSAVEKAIGSTSTIKERPVNKNIDINQYMDGLKDAVQYSLRSSEYYKQANVSATKGINHWMKLTASGGDNVINAMFDCLLETYYDWHDYIYFDIGSGAANSNAVSVILHVSKTPPATHTIGVSSNHNVKTGKIPTMRQLSSKNDVNDMLRLSMIKYFKKKNINGVSKAKAAFKPIVNMDEATVKSVFELDKDVNNDSIQECNTLMGSYNVQTVPSSNLKKSDFSALVTNQLMKKVLRNVGSINSSSYGSVARNPKMVGDGPYKGEWEIQYNKYYGCCTAGPSTWYRRAYKGMVSRDNWWNCAGSKANMPYTYQKTKKCLESAGFVAVWHGTLQEIDSLTKTIKNVGSNPIGLRPGDIATLYTGSGARQHGMMWTGEDWRSDCVQAHASCYSSSNQGAFAAVIWRHPKFQEQGNEVKPFT